MAMISTTASMFNTTGKRNWLDINPGTPVELSNKKQKLSKGHDRILEDSYKELQSLNARVAAIAAEIARLQNTSSQEGMDDSDHTCDPFDFDRPPRHDTQPLELEIDIIGSDSPLSKRDTEFPLMSQQELIHIISHLLPTEKLGRVIDIVSESSAAIVTTPTDEVEFDLSSLDSLTYGELSDFVHTCMCELNGIPIVPSITKSSDVKSPLSFASEDSSSMLANPPRKQKRSSHHPLVKKAALEQQAAESLSLTNVSSVTNAEPISKDSLNQSLGKRKRSSSTKSSSVSPAASIVATPASIVATPASIVATSAVAASSLAPSYVPASVPASALATPKKSASKKVLKKASPLSKSTGSTSTPTVSRKKKVLSASSDDNLFDAIDEIMPKKTSRKRKVISSNDLMSTPKPSRRKSSTKSVAAKSSKSSKSVAAKSTKSSKSVAAKPTKYVAAKSTKSSKSVAAKSTKSVAAKSTKSSPKVSRSPSVLKAEQIRESNVILLSPLAKRNGPETREVFKLEQVLVISKEEVDEDELIEIC
eukprot:TRINITY_DN552_c0_g1_i1.p1 TRINITY_DN552_c0_g1~~TRINITY_DN552_c0_g1_i1.p1  ORF type:complete len:534 (-),score=115.41 TRINITY_DN552_c0_g1_i1:236-1837(-)